MERYSKEEFSVFVLFSKDTLKAFDDCDNKQQKCMN